LRIQNVDTGASARAAMFLTSDGGTFTMNMYGSGASPASTGVLSLSSAASEFRINAGGTLGDSPNPLTFYSAGEERMRLTDDGKIGIGTTTPTANVSIIGNLSVSEEVIIGTSTVRINSTGITFSDGSVQTSAGGSDLSGNLTVSGGVYTGPDLAFTRNQIPAANTTASKDLLCEYEFGALYRAAWGEEVIAYSNGMLEQTIFNLGNRTTSLRYLPDTTNDMQYITTSSGLDGPLACIKKTAPLQFTRTGLNVADDDPTKDTACETEFGSNYKGATALDVTWFTKGMGTTSSWFIVANNSNNARYNLDTTNKLGYIDISGALNGYPLACRLKTNI
jgi:hypothetical protein